MTEAEVFEVTTGSGSSDFALLVSVLNEHGRWCLIDDLAVNCYVEPVYTLDADIVVAVSELNAIKSDLAIAAFAVEELPHSVNAQMKGSQLRVQLTTDLRYQAFLDETNLMEVLGEQVPVASLANIIQGKIWAWSDRKRRPTKRKKDELDLMRILEAYPEFRGSMPEEISRQAPE
ncbi:MAG TPA: hypothetical protein VN643_12980 [Pyrinomonadaceae bacterium]|nr:hypothetical protein [Pyrinomonadaceae bacterium]